MGKKENKKERRKLILRVKNGNEKLGHKGVLIIILMIRTGLLVWDAETNLNRLVEIALENIVVDVYRGMTCWDKPAWLA